MPRTRKPKLIDTIVHETGDKAEIHLDTETGKFFCSSRSIGERIDDTDLVKLKDTVKERLAQNGKLVWEPIIEVNYLTRPELHANGHEKLAGVNLKVGRYWIARRQGKAVTLRCWTWEDTEERSKIDETKGWPNRVTYTIPIDRAKHAMEWDGPSGDVKFPYHAPLSSWHNETTVYFAYSEELWNTLNGIVKAIDNAHNELTGILAVINLTHLSQWTLETHFIERITDDTVAK